MPQQHEDREHYEYASRPLAGPRPSLLSRLRRIWRPAVFQDGRKTHGYFEGWYFKCVDRGGDHAVAIIPGISLDRAQATSHAFVQLIHAGGETAYWEYPVSAFRYDPDRFLVEIGPNRFTLESIELSLEGEPGYVSGSLQMGPPVPWPVRALSPGIMGWYRFVPFMEAYHGVLSLDHSVEGALNINGESIDFAGGRGYTEKDWGRSFPSAWVWGQSNHFDSPGTSVSVSVARIPWMRGSFIGHIVGLLHNGTLHEFTTHNGARITRFELVDGCASMTLSRRDIEIDISISGARPGELRSPVMGAMSGTVWESLEATIEVTLRAEGKVVFQGSGRHAGVELMDEDSALQTGLGA